MRCTPSTANASAVARQLTSPGDGDLQVAKSIWSFISLGSVSVPITSSRSPDLDFDAGRLIRRAGGDPLVLYRVFCRVLQRCSAAHVHRPALGGSGRGGWARTTAPAHILGGSSPGRTPCGPPQAGNSQNVSALPLAGSSARCGGEGARSRTRPPLVNGQVLRKRRDRPRRHRPTRNRGPFTPVVTGEDPEQRRRCHADTPC